MAYTDAEVKGYIDNLKKQGGTARDIYDASQKYGVSAAQIDNSMDWETGTSKRWIDSNVKPTTHSQSTIKNFVNEQKGNAQAISDAQKKYGVSNRELNTAMGWEQGKGAAAYKQDRGNRTPEGLLENYDWKPPPVENNTDFSGGKTEYIPPAQTYSGTAGNLQTNIPDAPNVDASTYEDTAYDANTQEIDERATLRNQIAGYLDPDSDINKQIATQIRQQSSPGLRNSTMTDQAIYDAIIKNAIEMSKFDATQFGERSDLNLGYLNDASKTSAAFSNESGQFNANAENALKLQQSAAMDSERLAGINNNAKLAMIALEGDIGSASNHANLVSNQLIAAMNNQASLGSAEISADSQRAIAEINAQAELANTQLKGQWDDLLGQYQLQGVIGAAETKANMDYVTQLLQNDQVALSSFQTGLTNIYNQGLAQDLDGGALMNYVAQYVGVVRSNIDFETTMGLSGSIDRDVLKNSVDDTTGAHIDSDTAARLKAEEEERIREEQRQDFEDYGG